MSWINEYSVSNYRHLNELSSHPNATHIIINVNSTCSNINKIHWHLNQNIFFIASYAAILFIKRSLWIDHNDTISASLAFGSGNPQVTGEFPKHMPVTRSVDVLPLSKQWRRWWFERPSRSFWRHCNVLIKHDQTWKQRQLQNNALLFLITKQNGE